MKTLLDAWFGEQNKQLRTAIEHAAGITYYRPQCSVPEFGTLVCNEAGQFKLLTDRLALRWIQEGRHYVKLSPVVGRHMAVLESVRKDYWDYYASLQDCRAGPSDELAKRQALLAVLSEPTVTLHNNVSELSARRRGVSLHS